MGGLALDLEGWCVGKEHQHLKNNYSIITDTPYSPHTLINMSYGGNNNDVSFSLFPEKNLFRVLLLS